MNIVMALISLIVLDGGSRVWLIAFEDSEFLLIVLKWWTMDQLRSERSAGKIGGKSFAARKMGKIGGKI